jgi:hypothetical protein
VSAARPRLSNAEPVQSGRAAAARGARLSGRRRAPIQAAKSATATTIANTHRHDAASTSQPPTNGPTRLETPDHPAHAPTACPRSSSSKLASTRPARAGCRGSAHRHRSPQSDPPARYGSPYRARRKRRRADGRPPAAGMAPRSGGRDRDARGPTRPCARWLPRLCPPAPMTMAPQGPNACLDFQTCEEDIDGHPTALDWRSNGR